MTKSLPIKDLVTKAWAGKAEAQYRLGHAYLWGEGIEPDEKKALHWFLAAAVQGHVNAQNDAGTAYLRGIGTAANPEEATRWYRRSAEKGNAVAAYNVAMRYLNGHGAPCAPEAAAHWLAKSIEGGYTEAVTTLGRLHLSGTGVKKSYTTAADLLTSAAAAGDASTSEYLEPIKGALEVAALAGDQLAAVCLGRMHAQGFGCERNEMHAYSWYRWAAKKCSAGNVHDEANDSYKFFRSVLNPKERKQVEKWLDARAASKACAPAEGPT